MLFPLVLLTGLASAFPQAAQQCHGGFDFHGGHCVPTSSVGHFFPTSSVGHFPSASATALPWAPPGEGDVRSPCPALNTLANHFLLPHSGKNITVADVISAFAIGQNFAADVVTLAANGAIAQCSTVKGVACTGFDLDTLDLPHSIEHDGSLSREDYNYGRGDNHDFSFRVWGQVLHFWGDARIIDFALGMGARALRQEIANATDAPGWFVPAVGQGTGETAFYLSLFGDPVEGNARRDWIDVWFQQERMPFELGWNATQRETITSATLTAMIAKLEAV